eukprot:7281045-Pyramimonas_sp.AAC.1
MHVLPNPTQFLQEEIPSLPRTSGGSSGRRRTPIFDTDSDESAQSTPAASPAKSPRRSSALREKTNGQVREGPAGRLSVCFRPIHIP